MHEIESPFPIMFPLILYIHTVHIIVTRFTLSYVRHKKKQKRTAPSSCSFLRNIIARHRYPDNDDKCRGKLIGDL